jgi:hypothetical protein
MDRVFTALAFLIWAAALIALSLWLSRYGSLGAAVTVLIYSAGYFLFAWSIGGSD